jgi:hypothetical protein
MVTKENGGIDYGGNYTNEQLRKMSTAERLGPPLAATATGAVVTGVAIAVLGPLGVAAALAAGAVALAASDSANKK